MVTVCSAGGRHLTIPLPKTLANCCRSCNSVRFSTLSPNPGRCSVIVFYLWVPCYVSERFINLVYDAPSLDIVPWKLSVPTVRFNLASLKKKIQQTQKYINSSIYNLSLNTLCQKLFSPTVLKQRKELLRRLYPQNELKLLHVDFQTTVQYIQQS